jgi:murein DD-endopeptidase MepM/ murein hydrolase activator NlpD
MGVGKSDKAVRSGSLFPKARFTKAFIEENSLRMKGFAAWVLHPDMLFGARQNWWGSKKQRPEPHEGIDLCLFRDGCGRIIPVDERVRVPAMYDGIVATIVADFLGESIILEHRFPGDGRGVLLTIYGHTVRAEGLAEGDSVREGQVIASVAPPKTSKSSAPPHLHLTVAWSPTPISYDALNWETIGDSSGLQLLDPLPILNGIYEVVDNGNLLPEQREP